MIAGATSTTATGTSAIRPDDATMALAAADSRRWAEVAQQLSAVAWSMSLEEWPWASGLCIGQIVPLMQHAIRASAVACHLAHMATFPTDNVRSATIAARRRRTITKESSTSDATR